MAGAGCCWWGGGLFAAYPNTPDIAGDSLERGLVRWLPFPMWEKIKRETGGYFGTISSANDYNVLGDVCQWGEDGDDSQGIHVIRPPIRSA